MKKLCIKNIGPLTFVEMEVNRVNMIIGPQSSGKSTIAKILSFCLWLEKDIISHQEKEYVDGAFLQEKLLEYHKIENYLNKGAYFEYEGDFISFCYKSTEDFSIKLKDSFPESEIGKVAYIPAERNLAAITNVTTLPLPEYYVRDYLFDWLNLHSKFEEKNKVSILDLGASFYYDDEKKRDIVRLDNGKELEMNEVSSGLQSVIPLLVSLQYVTKWVFEHKEDLSFDKNSVLSKALIRTLSPDMDRENVEKALSLPKLVEQLQDTLKHILNADLSIELDSKYKGITRLNDRIGKPHYVNLIVEEPEQNLFPKTQVTLIYKMLRMLTRPNDVLLMTTHSPYALYALNNCILGHKVKDKLEEDDLANLPSKEAWIDGKEVSIWQINKRGELQNLKDPIMGLVGKHYFNDVMNATLNEYHTMIDYL